MKIYNASPLPNAPGDDALLPPALTTDRGFWAKGIAPEGGPITVPLPSGVVPEFDPQLLAQVCQRANASYNSVLILDVESPVLALSDSDPHAFGDWVKLLCDLRDAAYANGVKDVSFFGLPFGQNAVTQTESTLNLWERRSDALDPLLCKCTSVDPCLYSVGLDLEAFADASAYLISVCEKKWPDLPVRPFVSARQGFEGTSGAYDDLVTFYRRLVHLRAFRCIDALRYWDANFNTNFTGLAQTPFYNLLKLANQYPDLTYPPTDAGRPGGSAYFLPWPPASPASPPTVAGTAGH